MSIKTVFYHASVRIYPEQINHHQTNILDNALYCVVIGLTRHLFCYQQISITNSFFLFYSVIVTHLYFIQCLLHIIDQNKTLCYRVFVATYFMVLLIFARIDRTYPMFNNEN